jgi:hypothetical protein
VEEGGEVGKVRIVPRQINWYVLVVCFLSSIVMGIIAVVIAAQGVRHSEQKMCRVLITLEQPNEPATTERGEKIAAALNRLRHDYRCVS